MKPLVVIGLCLAIAGCNTPAADSFLGRADNAHPIQTYALGQPDVPAPLEAMLLLPPEAGGVLRVRERHFRNGTRQEIVLAGGAGGENILEVSLRIVGGDIAPRGYLQIGKPSQRGIATEAQARFPGMKMHVVTRPMNNMFGPFGLAIGRNGSERCVFAWQWIEDLRGAANGSRSPLASMMSGGAMPASVRMRMCRSNMTLDEMASFMEGLRPIPEAIDRVVRLDRQMVTSTPVADAAPLAPGGGFAAGALTTPIGDSLEAALPGPAAPRRVSAAPAASKPVAPPAPPRVTRSAPPKPPPKTPARYHEPAHQQPSGPRYLAPVEGVASSAPGSAATPPFGASRLDGSLPSRAYLGPGAAQR